MTDERGTEMKDLQEIEELTASKIKNGHGRNGSMNGHGRNGNDVDVKTREA